MFDGRPIAAIRYSLISLALSSPFTTSSNRSVVLLCNLTNHDGDPGEPCVVKLDDANSMLGEFEGTKKMAGVLGDSACAPKAIVYDAEMNADGKVYEYFSVHALPHAHVPRSAV